jgi:hypothetical protein
MQPSKEPRRADLLGVHSLDHFCVAVPDLALAVVKAGFILEADEQEINALAAALYTGNP